jgi:hypothetical protein
LRKSLYPNTVCLNSNLKEAVGMSLKHVANTTTDHASIIAGINEMQREDFLALAAALRQFNAYEPLVSMAVVNARHAVEHHSRLAAD